jgi:hypothetical protein
VSSAQTSSMRLPCSAIPFSLIALILEGVATGIA